MRYIVLAAGVLAASVSLSTSPVFADSTCECSDWAERTLKAIKRAPIRKARGIVLGALPKACATIPQELRAAASAKPKRAPKTQTSELASAAAQIVGNGCAVDSPSEPAANLPATCNVPQFAPSNDAVKADMRASDYLVLLALVKIWKEHGLLNDTADRLFQSFELSAALHGEQERARRTSR